MRTVPMTSVSSKSFQSHMSYKINEHVKEQKGHHFFATIFTHTSHQSAYLGILRLQGSKKQLSHIFATYSQRTLVDYVSKAARNSTS
eukprot:8271718-Ditylum_brightwellii.AAC.1